MLFTLKKKFFFFKKLENMLQCNIKYEGKQIYGHFHLKRNNDENNNNNNNN